MTVLEGMGELLPPQDDELDVLDIFGLSPDTHRLACQAKMRPGLATLRVRAIEDDF
jgi:ferredoxin